MIMEIYRQYKAAIKAMNEEWEPDIVLLEALFLSSILFVYVGLFVDIFLGGLLALIVMDLAVGYPIHRVQKRIESIEKGLPDVLNHIAISIRAGATVEAALKEIAEYRYGILSKEMKKVLLAMKKGKTFEDAFRDFAESSGSPLVEKTAEVIISAKMSGGGLTAALTSIADDIRHIYRLKKERKARTTTQVLFIIVAANFVAPMIFSLLTGVMQFMGYIAGEAATPAFEAITFYFKVYLIISAVFSSVAAALIREGNLSKVVIYAPVLLLITYGIYMGVSSFALKLFIGG